jgi:hypothetical protein
MCEGYFKQLLQQSYPWFPRGLQRCAFLIQMVCVCLIYIYVDEGECGCLGMTNVIAGYEL